MVRLAEEFGPALTGRAFATDLRERIERAVAEGQIVVLDFSGVEAMSPSFADEVFAKLPTQLTDSGAVRFENLPDHLLAIARVVADREARFGG